jgi:hypothetical protein
LQTADAGPTRPRLGRALEQHREDLSRHPRGEQQQTLVASAVFGALIAVVRVGSAAGGEGNSDEPRFAAVFVHSNRGRGLQSYENVFVALLNSVQSQAVFGSSNSRRRGGASVQRVLIRSPGVGHSERNPVLFTVPGFGSTEPLPAFASVGDVREKLVLRALLTLHGSVDVLDHSRAGRTDAHALLLVDVGEPLGLAVPHLLANLRRHHPRNEVRDLEEDKLLPLLHRNRQIVVLREGRVVSDRVLGPVRGGES